MLQCSWYVLVDNWAYVDIAYFTLNNTQKFDTLYAEHSLYMCRRQYLILFGTVYKLRHAVLSMGSYFSLIFHPTVMKSE